MLLLAIRLDKRIIGCVIFLVKEYRVLAVVVFLKGFFVRIILRKNQAEPFRAGGGSFFSSGGCRCHRRRRRCYRRRTPGSTSTHRPNIPQFLALLTQYQIKVKRRDEISCSNCNGVHIQFRIIDRQHPREELRRREKVFVVFSLFGNPSRIRLTTHLLTPTFINCLLLLLLSSRRPHLCILKPVGLEYIRVHHSPAYDEFIDHRHTHVTHIIMKRTQTPKLTVIRRIIPLVFKDAFIKKCHNLIVLFHIQVFLIHEEWLDECENIL